MIAHAADAEFAKIGQVLTHLGAIDSARLGQGIGGNDLHIIAGKVFKHLHVCGQALNGCARDVFAFRLVSHSLPSGKPRACQREDVIS